MLDPPEVLREAKPARLHDIFGIGVAEPVSAGNGPEQSGKAIDELVPGRLVALSGSADECAEISLPGHEGPLTCGPPYQAMVSMYPSAGQAVAAP